MCDGCWEKTLLPLRNPILPVLVWHLVTELAWPGPHLCFHTIWMLARLKHELCFLSSYFSTSSSYQGFRWWENPVVLKLVRKPTDRRWQRSSSKDKPREGKRGFSLRATPNSQRAAAPVSAIEGLPEPLIHINTTLPNFVPIFLLATHVRM